MAGVEHADAAGEINITLASGIPDFGVLRVVGEKFAHHAHAAWGGFCLALEQVRHGVLL
jgi:hypothetical protein